jgi:hypothetical protein
MQTLVMIMKDKSTDQEHIFYVKHKQLHNNNGTITLKNYNKTENVNIMCYYILKENNIYVLRKCTHTSGIIIFLPDYIPENIENPYLPSVRNKEIRNMYYSKISEYEKCIKIIENLNNVIEKIRNDESIFNFKVDHTNIIESRLTKTSPYGLMLEKYSHLTEDLCKTLIAEKFCKYLSMDKLNGVHNDNKNREIKKVIYLYVLYELKKFLNANKIDLNTCLKNIQHEYDKYKNTREYKPQYVCKNVYNGYFNTTFIKNETNVVIEQGTSNWKNLYTEIFTIVTNEKKYLYKNETGGIQYTDTLCLVKGPKWNLFPAFNGNIYDFDYNDILSKIQNEINIITQKRTENEKIYNNMSILHNIILNETNCHIYNENE